mgnify:CR=1 FL=1
MKKFLLLFLVNSFFVYAQEQDACYSVKELYLEIEEQNPPLAIDLNEGWNMIGFPCREPLDVEVALSSIQVTVIILKDNNGSVYLPEFGFNGIGNFTKLHGYQIKLNDSVVGFSFCSPIALADRYGCTDCEALNFNQWANIDDGTCIEIIQGCTDNSYFEYNPLASEEDGSCLTEVYYGCTNPLALNYNQNANTDNGSCNYEVQIGDLAAGGIVFYIDETGQHGLVAALEGLTEGATDPYEFGWNGYEWGCYQEDVLGADQTSISTGYGNTADILNQVCETENGGITASLGSLDFESEGYSDWYIPSKDELVEMYTILGQGSENGNIGGFDNYFYWSSSEYNAANAWGVNFNYGFTFSTDKNLTGRVRVIRAF